MQNQGRGGRRLALSFVFALACSALAPAVAGADTVRLDSPQPNEPEYSNASILGEAGVLHTRKQRYALDYEGTQHVTPGTRVVLTPASVPAGWTASDVVFEIPEGWGIGSTVRADATLTWLSVPSVNIPYTFSWVPSEAACVDLDGTGCVTPAPPRTINALVNPRPPSGLAIDPGVNAATISWEPSPDHAVLSEYRITRFRNGTFDQIRQQVVPATEPTSWSADGLDPDTEYCWRMIAVHAGLVGSATAEKCARTGHNPPAPGSAPRGPALDDDGRFDLTWSPAPEAGVQYEIEHRDADDSAWLPFATGADTPYGAAEEEGTWRYRVRSTAFHAASDWVEAPDTETVKVDMTRPTAPTATTNPAEAAHDGWFKDSVTVSFGGGSDPALADSSAGSGVDPASYTGPQTFDTDGEHTATGTVKDAARHESEEAAKTVKVDATAPTTEIACPAEPLIVGQPDATAAWTAADRQSGLATPESGEIPLDTATAGVKTATAPTARDRVGHTADGTTCEYEVRYRFAGGVAPVEGSNVVNVGRRERIYPVRWRLQRWDGSPISDAQGTALAGQMAVTDNKVACMSFLSAQEDGLEEETLSPTTSPRYDTTYNWFVYSYKAPAAGCFTLDVRRADGLNTKRWRFLFLP